MATEVVAAAWKRQSQWSMTADQLKTRFVRWRRVVFALTVVAAVSASLSVELQSGSLAKGLALLAAVCAAISPVISSHKTNKDKLQAWTRARSVSEELKSSIFKYLINRSTDRVRRLNNAQEAAIENVRDIVPAQSSANSQKIDLLEDITVDDYIRIRLLEQAESYYFPQAKNNSVIAGRFHHAYFVMMLIAAVVSAINALSELHWLGHWTAVFTTLGASALAYLAAGRYEYLSLSYQATGDQLINLRNRWEARPESDRIEGEKISEFVDDCEAVISNQNQSWHAKLSSIDDTSL